MQKQFFKFQNKMTDPQKLQFLQQLQTIQSQLTQMEKAHKIFVKKQQETHSRPSIPVTPKEIKTIQTEIEAAPEFVPSPQVCQ